MNESKQIRFIDPEYNTLFTIPDGGSIVVTRPEEEKFPGVQEQHIGLCKYIDETHVKINERTWHICEYAEKIREIRATIMPEPEPEMIGSYRVTHRTFVGEKTFKLGLNPDASQPYGTWVCFTNEQDRNNFGHYWHDSGMEDIVMGTFIVCGVDADGNFASLSAEDMAKFSEKFHVPELFECIESGEFQVFKKSVPPYKPYTFCRATAAENLEKVIWLDETAELFRDMGYESIPLDRGAETIDVIIRCALVNEFHSDVESLLDELDEREATKVACPVAETRKPSLAEDLKNGAAKSQAQFGDGGTSTPEKLPGGDVL